MTENPGDHGLAYEAVQFTPADRSITLRAWCLPAPDARAALVFVHGGGWNFGDKRAVNALPAYAERHGFLLVSVGYRLTPEVTARGCAEDVAAAVACVAADAAAVAAAAALALSGAM